MEIKSNDRLIRQIVKQATREAIKESLENFGVDTSNPSQMRADMLYIRKNRLNNEFIVKHIKIAVIGILIPAIVYLLWGAIKNSII